MIGAVLQKPRQAIVEILDFMRSRDLALNDLIQIGGEDLKSSNPKCAEKAHRVSKCSELMARLSVKFADLEQAAGQHTAEPARRRRGEEVFPEVIENTGISTDDPREVKPLKNNNKTDNHSVGLSENSAKGRWKHKRRLALNPERAVAP
jgi:hypothetical protein